ncbi:leucine-rich repeat extensin-like protein 1 [Penaeus monodon]|uniref:leucine-rich repeat extensin-like protein 1 n=1 Tax=Penaeus monodon TaxID=6687 RepID=UPI0018A72B86|nr:leucine-rich repeat extensin-like protein 1 [Penaeus monodon]
MYCLTPGYAVEVPGIARPAVALTPPWPKVGNPPPPREVFPAAPDSVNPPTTASHLHHNPSQRLSSAPYPTHCTPIRCECTVIRILNHHNDLHHIFYINNPFTVSFTLYLHIPIYTILITLQLPYPFTRTIPAPAPYPPPTPYPHYTRTISIPYPPPTPYPHYTRTIPAPYPHPMHADLWVEARREC